MFFSSTTKWEKSIELKDRSCDALVLAYSPENVIEIDADKEFYIPGSKMIEDAFGYSLRSLFGQKDSPVHWADSVKWSTIGDLSRLETRIFDGTHDVTSSNPDFKSIFDAFFSNRFGRFDEAWIYGKGNLYRFKEGKREEALQKFSEYWDAGEISRWNQIHELMKKYSEEKKLFKVKFVLA